MPTLSNPEYLFFQRIGISLASRFSIQLLCDWVGFLCYWLQWAVGQMYFMF